jgi:hypothetical protein
VDAATPDASTAPDALVVLLCVPAALPERLTDPAPLVVFAACVLDALPVALAAEARYFAAPMKMFPPDCSVLTVAAIVSVCPALFAAHVIVAE